MNPISFSSAGTSGSFSSAALISFSAFAVLCISAHAQKRDTLRVSILGDSYSTFEGYVTPDTNALWYFKPENPQLHAKNDVRKVEQTWWYQTIQNLGAKLERNNAYSGSTVCGTGYLENNLSNIPYPEFAGHTDYMSRAFITRSNNLGEPDLILIFGATNDSWCKAPAGEYVYGNWTNRQLYTFRPAMAKLLYDLKANYPQAKLLFILNTELREDITESVHTICKHYGVKCLDLKNIDKQHGHPSIKGMASIAEQVTAAVKQMQQQRGPQMMRERGERMNRNGQNH